jgi:hypothetical protein
MLLPTGAKRARKIRRLRLQTAANLDWLQGHLLQALCA